MSVNDTFTKPDLLNTKYNGFTYE